MGLVLDWKKKLGYTKDPFEQVVFLPVGKYVTGLQEQKEKFNLFLIKEDTYGTVSGERGTGKTTFLSWMEEQLGGSIKAAYIDASEKSKRAQFTDALLGEKASFFARKISKTLDKPQAEKEQLLMKKLAVRHVVLIDNAGSLAKDTQELLMQIMEKTPTHVVCADTKERLAKLDLQNDKLGLRTQNYSSSELITILRKRIESAGGSGTFPFEDEQLEKLAEQADGNPAKFLALTREKAIELSLKTGKPPKKAAEPAPEGVKRLGFFNIKFVDPDEKKVEETKPAPTSAVEHHEDAAMLAQIVQPETRSIEQKAQPREEHDTAAIDRMIKQLAEETPAQKKASAKKTTKKK